MRRSGLRIKVLVIFGALLGTLGVGCSGGQVAYRGPFIDAKPVAGKFQLTCYAPTAGWRFEIDREVFVPATLREVYVTVRRPDQDTVRAQMIVEHVLRTNLNSYGPLFVYARVVGVGDEVTKDKPEHVQVQMFRP